MIYSEYPRIFFAIKMSEVLNIEYCSIRCHIVDSFIMVFLLQENNKQINNIIREKMSNCLAIYMINPILKLLDEYQIFYFSKKNKHLQFLSRFKFYKL